MFGINNLAHVLEEFYFFGGCLGHNYYIFTKVVFNEQLLKMRTKNKYVISRINVKHKLPFYVAFDCLRYVVLF